MITDIPALMEYIGARVMGGYTRMTFDGVEYRVVGRAYQPSKAWRYDRQLYRGRDLTSAVKAFSDYEIKMKVRKEHELANVDG